MEAPSSIAPVAPPAGQALAQEGHVLPSLTDEGRTAVQLDAAEQLKLNAGFKKSAEPESLDDGVDQLGNLMNAVAARYGEMAPVCAPVYFAYGDAMLASVETSKEALGGPAAAAVGAGDDEDEDDADDDGAEEDEDKVEQGGASAPATSAPNGDAAEEDISGEDGKEKEDDDLEIAWECLDVARVIYERMIRPEQYGPTPALELELARVHLRLGDCHMEGEKFQLAVTEYLAAFKLRAKHMKMHDRKLADPLSRLMLAYCQLADDKDVTDTERKSLLLEAVKYAVAAAEVLTTAAREVASLASNHAFVHGVAAEVAAGALTKVYLKGIPITTAVGAGAPPGAVGSMAGAGAGAGVMPGLGVESSGDVDVRIFRTLYASHPGQAPNAEAVPSSTPSSSSSAPAAAAGPTLGPSHPSKPLQLSDLCEVIDSLINKVNEIQDDLSVSIQSIKHEVGGPGEGAHVETGFGSAGSAAAAAPATMLAPVRRSAPAPTHAPEAVHAGDRRPLEVSEAQTDDAGQHQAKRARQDPSGAAE